MDQTSYMDNFVDVYKNWLESSRWAAKTELTALQRQNLAKLETIKRTLWNALPEPRRSAIVAELVSQGILPKELPKCLDIFDGRVIGL